MDLGPVLSEVFSQVQAIEMTAAIHDADIEPAFVDQVTYTITGIGAVRQENAREFRLGKNDTSLAPVRSRTSGDRNRRREGHIAVLDQRIACDAEQLIPNLSPVGTFINAVSPEGSKNDVEISSRVTDGVNVAAIRVEDDISDLPCPHKRPMLPGIIAAPHASLRAGQGRVDDYLATWCWPGVYHDLKGMSTDKEMVALRRVDRQNFTTAVHVGRAV